MGATTTKDTRQRILDAASDVFAQHGFDKATVREICHRADANVAAVNYHFRDKKELFTRVLKQWMFSAEERYPFDYGMPQSPKTDEQLFGFFRAMLLRIFRGNEDPEVSYCRACVLVNELTSGLLKEVKQSEENQCTMEDYLAPLAARYLETSDSELVRDTVHSIMGQVIIYLLGYVMDPAQFTELRRDEEVERIAQHLSIFSLGGLRAVKESL